MGTHDRTDHSLADPNFRWQGADVTRRPTPEQCDELRRTAQAHNANLTGAVETAVLSPEQETAMLTYTAGISSKEIPKLLVALERELSLLSARVEALEARVDKLKV